MAPKVNNVNGNLATERIEGSRKLEVGGYSGADLKWREGTLKEESRKKEYQ